MLGRQELGKGNLLIAVHFVLSTGAMVRCALPFTVLGGGDGGGGSGGDTEYTLETVLEVVQLDPVPDQV